MGRREFNKLAEKYPWIRFCDVWGNKSGRGKWMKRQLSKARRRYIKQVLKTGRRNREPTGYETEVNWRGW